MNIRDLHNRAMDLAEQAMFERAAGLDQQSRISLQAALESEQQAARLAIESGAPEPTRSILLRSAAHLAIDAGDHRLAQKLIATALAGDPPEELGEQLLGLLEEIGFNRHLNVTGVELDANDVQMVMVGNAVAPGMVAADQFTSRIETLQRLVYRTSECDRKVEYRERGDPALDTARSLQVYMSVPRAASFAVSIKVARRVGQSDFTFAESALVLDNLMDRLRLFEEAKFSELRKLIPSVEYYRNFIELAAELSPDGDLVKMVGFTTRRNQVEKRLLLRRPSRQGGQSEDLPRASRRRELKGRVVYFYERSDGQRIVKVRTGDAEEFNLKLDSDAKLNKLVKYVGRKGGVKVTGLQRSKSLFEVEDVKSFRLPGKSKGKKGDVH